MIETNKKYIFPTFLLESIDTEFNYQQDLINFCYQLKSQASNFERRSNVNGWQSPIFTPQNNSKFFENNFVHSIWNQIIETSKNLNLDKVYNFYLSSMWVNINSPGSYNLSHIHPMHFLSGVFYIKTPENSGSIVFENMFERNTSLSWVVNDDNIKASEKIIPEEGKMLLFNSYLPHRIEQNNSLSDRISISFDVDIGKFYNQNKKTKHIF